MIILTKEITIEIKSPELILILIVLLGIFVLELQVTFNTPITFGDEGFHTRMAQYIAEEREYPLYSYFIGSKLLLTGFTAPPLWNILEGGFLFVFGFHESIIKFLTPFIAFLTGLVVFILTKKIFNKNVAFIATIITITIPSFVTYSVLFYKDALFTLFLSMFYLLFILAIKNDSKKYWILSAIYGGFTLLTKNSGIFVFPFIILAFLYQLYKEKKFYGLFKKYLFLFLIIILIQSTFFLRIFYYYNNPFCGLPYLGNLFDRNNCHIRDFKGNYSFAGRTEEVGTEMGVLKMGVMNYLNFAYGNIYFVILGLCAGLIILISKRTDINILILLILLTLLPVFYYSMPRAEDAARYMLGWVAIISIVIAKYFEEIYNFIKKYQKYVALIVFVIVIVLGFQVLMEKLDTMVKVKQFSPLFFEACDWIKENTQEDSLIFTVWAYRAVYNCQRDVMYNLADISLSKDVNYTLSTADQLGITHIFIQKFSLSNEALGEKYSIDFIQLLEDNPDHFKKVYENGMPLQQCLQQGGCDGNIVYEIIS